LRRELACNKRNPGSGCGARQGENRLHAIFGASEHCAATHASDLAVALLAADARLRVCGASGERDLPLAELYLPPIEHPQREHSLARGELITEIVLGDTPYVRRAHYLKVRDRAAFDFALVSVAAGLWIEAGRIRDARLVAGGVGTVPWRLHSAEALLIGHRAVLEVFAAAAASAAQHAMPLAQNQFKVKLLERTVLRALQSVMEGSPQ